MKLKNNPLTYYLIFIFIFTLIFSLLIPLGGDDWGNYLYQDISFSGIIDVAINFYQTWEGRFFSRIFDLLLIPKPMLWVFVNAIVMTLLFYFMCKILNIKKNYLPLVLLCILFVDMQTFAQVYVWKTGNITYFIPMVFAFFLIFTRKNLFNDEEQLIRKKDYFLVPLTFIFSMFVENVAAGIIVICILNIIFYYLKYKKIDKPFVLCLIAAILGFSLMTFSPGSMSRLSGEEEFATLSIFGKLLYNIPNLINYTFIKNSFLLILFIISMSTIVNRNFKNKFLKYISLAFIIIIPLTTAIISFISNFLTLPNIVLKLINPENIFIIIYWLLFLIFFLFLIIKYYKSDKKIWYFIILAITSNGAMMFSPVWGGRTACFTTFMLYITLIFIIKDLNLKIFENKKTFITLNIICGLFMLLFIIYSFIIYNLNIDRNKYINYQLENNAQAEKYEIIILPGYYVWNLNTWGSEGDFAYNFKRAYGIKEDAELIYVKRSDVNIDLDALNVSSKLKY